MSDEIKINLRVNVENGEYKESFAPSVNLDQTSLGGESGVALVDTTSDSLTLQHITNNGVLMMQNLDTTNYVDWGLDSTGTLVAIGRMQPEEPALLRLQPGITLRWQADTAPCKVRYILLED